MLQLKTDNVLHSVVAITKETPPINSKYRHNILILALLLSKYTACFIHLGDLLHKVLKNYLGL